MHTHTYIHTHKYVQYMHTHTYTPPLNCFNKFCKIIKLSASSPYSQARHVGHVPGLGGSRGTAIHHACLGQVALQTQHSQAGLAPAVLLDTGRNQVLGLVTLVKYNLGVWAEENLLLDGLLDNTSTHIHTPMHTHTKIFVFFFFRVGRGPGISAEAHKTKITQ